MNIPDKVKVGGMTYVIERFGYPVVLDGHECYGRIDHNAQIIRISGDPKFSEQTATLTFFHELIHAFTHQRGLDWGDKDELYTEELAKALHAFSVDNGFGFVESAQT